MFPVGENREQVAGGVTVDADREEVIDDEKIRLGQFTQQLVVRDAVTAGDDQPAGEVVLRA